MVVFVFYFMVGKLLVYNVRLRVVDEVCVCLCVVLFSINYYFLYYDLVVVFLLIIMDV